MYSRMHMEREKRKIDLTRACVCVRRGRRGKGRIREDYSRLITVVIESWLSTAGETVKRLNGAVYGINLTRNRADALSSANLLLYAISTRDRVIRFFEQHLLQLQ